MKKIENAIVTCHVTNFIRQLRNLMCSFSEENIDPQEWMNSVYQPTPTIIEAAQALYAGHNVEDISRSDAGAQNLAITASAIDEIIENSKRNKRKSSQSKC